MSENPGISLLSRCLLFRVIAHCLWREPKFCRHILYCTVVLKGQSLKIKRLWYFEILYKLSCFYFLQHPQARACFRQIIFFIRTTKMFEFRCSSTRFSKTSLFYLILERNTVCRFFEIYILPIFKDISRTAI